MSSRKINSSKKKNDKKSIIMEYNDDDDDDTSSYEADTNKDKGTNKKDTKIPQQQEKKTKTTKTNKAKKLGEIQIQKSPAEFFAENQSIAGFDNLGKSLYTAIRELIENSLDACEAIHELPNICIDITEYNQEEYNAQSSTIMMTHDNDLVSPIKTNIIPIDSELFETKESKKKKKDMLKKKLSFASTGNDDDEIEDEQNNDNIYEKNNKNNSNKKKNSAKKGSSKSNSNASSSSQSASYFLIKVKDNGCGVRHDDIPHLFGKVLSGSKYGVRQTRGKFGLGAKMALIWAKKSTGQPIRIVTCHRPTSTCPPNDIISTCVLDINIYQNEPRILEHTKIPNNTIDQQQPYIGTEVHVFIAGNWTTYKSRIVQYIQQLAIITPYAALQLQYTNISDTKRNILIQYHRRSEQMPTLPIIIKYHPSSVNNIIIQQLIEYTKTKTLIQFLCKELSGVSISISKRIINELLNANIGILSDTMSPKLLTNRHITRLVQLFHQVQLFKLPDSSCLSPLGEYNFNLGIMKVLQPLYIATVRDKPNSYDGHPFMIEAAVCIGSQQMKDGISIYRYANRIPLLFEGGADVTTRVALTKIKWNSYKIDYKRDKVGVFISIVSTKIPFKGTSKEYIGDDVLPIHDSVKRSIQLCCQQLRIHLNKRQALYDAKNRQKRLEKYIPDIGRSLSSILEQMSQRQLVQHDDDDDDEVVEEEQNDNDDKSNNNKRRRIVPSLYNVSDHMNHKNNNTNTIIKKQKLIHQYHSKIITKDTIEQCLQETIRRDNSLINDNEQTTTIVANNSNNNTTTNNDSIPIHIIPLYNLNDNQNDIIHPHFMFRPIYPITYKKE